MPEDCRSITRRFYAWEAQEARRVFADQLAYERVKIHECTNWPNRIDQLGAWLKRVPYRGLPNAITLGNDCYFPVNLPQNLVSIDHPEHYKIPWLIHELTHVWQYQRLGWRYLFQALEAQFKSGAQVYVFGGEAGLIEAFQQGRKFSSFNMEQQGDICRTYYERLSRGVDISAWLPFITELQQAGNS